MGGVLVSDGLHVTRTDDQGEYRLTVDSQSGPFLFVTLPAGFWTDDFFVSRDRAVSDGRADFALRPIAQPAQFCFAFLTDIHLENRRSGVQKFAESLREINQLSPQPAFLWLQGDICLQGGSGDVYLDTLKQAEMPVRHGAGNHEMMLAHQDPRDDFHRFFGPTYYSFDWAGVHCIVLDGNKPIPGENDWRAVHGAIEGRELAWLRADLAAQPKGKPIIVGIHIPIVTTYPQRRAESPPDAPYWEVQNRDVITDLFTEHGVRLVLQGHMHENERIVVGGVEYVESMSLSGSWWQASEGMERGVDGVPRGYRIISVDGAQITHRYHSSCESHVDARGEWLGLEKPIAASGPVDLVFNAFDAPNGSQAEARIDDGPWQTMEPFDAVNTKINLKMPHHFRLRLDTGDLASGDHRLVSRVIWPDGTSVVDETQLQIAVRN